MARLLLILGAAVAVAAFIWRPPAPAPPASVATPNFSGPPKRHHRLAEAQTPAVVYVAGAVVRPGLYRLPSGARADDAVRSAGGFRSDADTGAINLAAHVGDGDEVFVTVLGQPTAHPARSSRARRAKKQSVTAVVDLNSASPQELATVPGIGMTLAARIVDVRERDGAYTSFDELLDVAGMTTSRLQRAQPYLRI